MKKLIFVVLFASTPVFAGPFCLVSGAGSPDCGYSDMNACRQNAAAVHGACVVNQQAVSPQFDSSALKAPLATIDPTIPMRNIQPIPQIQPIKAVDVKAEQLKSLQMEVQRQQLEQQLRNNQRQQATESQASTTESQDSESEAKESNWVWFYADSVTSGYVDSANISKATENVNIWWISDLKKNVNSPSVVSSIKFHDEFNCSQKQRRNYASISFSEKMGRGKALNSEYRESPVWSAVPSYGVAEALLHYVCGVKQPSATQPTQSAPSNQLQLALASLKEESNGLCTTLEFAELFVKSACNPTDITFDQLSDGTKITKKQKVTLKKYRARADAIAIENQEALRRMGGDAGKQIADFLESTMWDAQKNSLNLYKGDITWGGYSQRRKELAVKIQAATKSIAQVTSQ